MSTAPFGEHLKREREMRGVSLEEISAATRISTRFLEALEKDQWEQLPGGVFNRGFIRSIARFLGLDEESLVAEYSLETKNRVDTRVVPNPPMEMQRNWGPAIVAFGLLAAFLAGGWFIYAHYGAQIAARFHRKHAASTSSTAAPRPSSSSGTTALLLVLNGQIATPIGLPGPSRYIALTHQDLMPSAGGRH
jgi:cytoskeletal protein RodZ